MVVSFNYVIGRVPRVGWSVDCGYKALLCQYWLWTSVTNLPDSELPSPGEEEPRMTRVFAANHPPEQTRCSWSLGAQPADTGNFRHKLSLFLKFTEQGNDLKNIINYMSSSFPHHPSISTVFD